MAIAVPEGTREAAPRRSVPSRPAQRRRDGEPRLEQELSSIAAARRAPSRSTPLVEDLQVAADGHVRNAGAARTRSATRNRALLAHAFEYQGLTLPARAALEAASRAPRLFGYPLHCSESSLSGRWMSPWPDVASVSCGSKARKSTFSTISHVFWPCHLTRSRPGAGQSPRLLVP